MGAQIERDWEISIAIPIALPITLHRFSIPMSHSEEVQTRIRTSADYNSSMGDLISRKPLNTHTKAVKLGALENVLEWPERYLILTEIRH